MQEMQETQVPSLGWEDPLEEEMATHSSILVWKIPWTEEPGGLQPWGSKELDSSEHAAHVDTEGILLGVGGAEGLTDLGQGSHLRCVLEKGVLPGQGLAGRSERGLPGRGTWPLEVGCPHVSDTCEPEVCPVSLESPGDFWTEAPGRVQCAEP